MLSMVIDHIDYIINQKIITPSLTEPIFVHKEIEYIFFMHVCYNICVSKMFSFSFQQPRKTTVPCHIKCSLNYNVHVTTFTRKNFTWARRSLLTSTVHICELLQRTTSLRQFDYHDHTGISTIDQFCDNNAPQYFRYSNDG